MEQILDFVQSFDFKNFDFLATLNSLLGLVRVLLGDFIGEGGI